MFDTRPLSVIRSELDKLKQDQVSFIAGGGAKDFAEYRHICGIIRGLTHADEIVKDLVQRIDTDE